MSSPWQSYAKGEREPVVEQLLNAYQHLAEFQVQRLLVDLPDGTQGWLYSIYVDTQIEISDLPLREAYGGPLSQPQPLPIEERQPLSINVTIENNIAHVTVSGFPDSSSILAWLGPDSGRTNMLVAQTTATVNGNAQFYFTMPETWEDGSPVTSGEMVLVVSTGDGSFSVTANIQYLK